VSEQLSTDKAARVLVVDRDPQTSVTVMDTLGLAANAVIAVSTGSEALAAVQAQRFDVVLWQHELVSQHTRESLRTVRLKQPDALVALLCARGAPCTEDAQLDLGVDRIIRTPLDVSKLRRVVAERGQEEPVPDRPRVLIVDDDEMVLESIHELIGGEYEAAATGSPREALRLINDRPFDVLITDVMMEEMNGIELIRAARTIRPVLVAIVVTGYGTKKVAIEAVREGAYDFLEKPLSPDVLLQTVDRAWRTLRAEMESRRLLVELKRANRELKRQIAERSRVEQELVRSQKMEAVGLLAGGVAHDLNNVLAGLVSYPDWLLKKLPQDSPYRTPITRIRRSGEKAAAIVQDLLAVTRRGAVTMEVVDLNGIISDFLKSPEYFNIKLYHPDVEVEVDQASDLYSCLAQPVHVSKAVMNLVSNAAEAVTEGGTISIATFNRDVEEGEGRYEQIARGSYAVVAVSDTGTGIAAEHLARIFEPFYSKKKLGRSGTGLGMSVVWWTVKDCDGYIDIESEMGEGTCFKLYFPATRIRPVEAEAPAIDQALSGTGESILVVDDVEEQRTVTAEILREQGYDVATASSGEEAVAYLEHCSADLVILDMIMDPGIGGLETYRRIIALHPGQKAILFSGYTETDEVKEAQRLGAGALLKKPFSFERLCLVVQAELKK
jgi:DNA-binding NtrC family response regulator